MEVYEAKFDYVRERDDVLSFTKGDKFYISNKTNAKWWAAKRVGDNAFGYVPSVYLKPSSERVIGRLVPEGRRDTEEHKIHLRALAEIHKKVKPLPAHVIGQAIGVELDSSDEDEEVKRLPRKQIHIPPTAFALEGLTQDKVPLLRKCSHQSHTHGDCFMVTTTIPSPTSPTLPTPPTSPIRLPPYRKPSWPHYPLGGGVLGPQHLGPQQSIFASKKTKEKKAKVDDDDDDEEDDDLPEYLKTLSPPPMISPPPPDYDLEDESTDKNDMPFHHQLNSSGRLVSLSSEDSSDLSPTSPPGDDALLIKPKPLPNPVKDSREHKSLHRELKLSYKKDGGPLPQKSELSVVHRERKLDEKRREIEKEKKAKRTSMELKLLERQEKERMEEEKASMKEQEAIEEESKPEFMKVRLKQTKSLPKS